MGLSAGSTDGVYQDYGLNHRKHCRNEAKFGTRVYLGMIHNMMLSKMDLVRRKIRFSFYKRLNIVLARVRVSFRHN
jgi:hypothetical protein